jgi:uncharacterized protein YdgA (DUF945 family)
LEDAYGFIIIFLLFFSKTRAEFAFNPKNVNLSKKGSSPGNDGKMTESEIVDKINRLSQTLSNAVCSVFSGLTNR